MRKLMRVVLEELQDQQENKRTVVMTGPLSDVYTKALNEVYAKTDHDIDDDDSTTVTPALEAGNTRETVEYKDRALVKQTDKEDKEEKPSMESQQQDATIAQTIANAINQQDENEHLQLATDAVAQPFSPGNVNVYGVSADKITPDDIINVANGDGPGENWVVIVDGTRPSVNGPESNPTETMVNLAQTMESLVTKIGGRFYHSLEEFVEDITKPKTDPLGNGDPSAKPNHGYLNEKGTDGNGGADGTTQDGQTGIVPNKENPGADGTSTNGEDNATGQHNTVPGEGIDTNNPVPGTASKVTDKDSKVS